METLVFYSSKNSKGKKDATAVFIPESQKFATVNSVSASQNCVISVDCTQTKDERKKDVIREILCAGSIVSKPIDAIAFFCHGWTGGIQVGIWKKDIKEFVQALIKSCSKSLIITLYACLTAENDVPDNDWARPGPGTDGGFADLLRDEMGRQGFVGHVDAHKTAGHASMNPYVVRFECSGIDDLVRGGRGGKWLIPRGTFWGVWSQALHDPANTLRYRFPFMSSSQIIYELSTGRV